MDPQAFDGMVQTLSRALGRRSFVGGSLGGAVLAAVGVTSVAAGTSKKGQVKAAGLQDNQRCDPPKQCRPHGEKKCGCNDCATGFSVASTNDRGKAIRKCACKPGGQPCTANTAWQCCGGVCNGVVCQVPQTAPPPPPTCPLTPLGGDCLFDEECCSGVCDDFTDRCCLPEGAACVTSSDCCFDDDCLGGICV